MDNIIKKYLTNALLFGYVVDIALQGATMADVGVILALAGFISFREYTEKHKKIQEVVTTVTKQNEIITAMVKEVDNLKTSMVGLKMGQGFKKL